MWQQRLGGSKPGFEFTDEQNPDSSIKGLSSSKSSLRYPTASCVRSEFGFPVSCLWSGGARGHALARIC